MNHQHHLLNKVKVRKSYNSNWVYKVLLYSLKVGVNLQMNTVHHERMRIGRVSNTWREVRKSALKETKRESNFGITEG